MNGNDDPSKSLTFSEIYDLLGDVNRNKNVFRVPSNMRILSSTEGNKILFLAYEEQKSDRGLSFNKDQALFCIDVPNSSEVNQIPWSFFCDVSSDREAKTMSLAEELLYERQRASLHPGISSFEVLSPSNDLLIHMDCNYYLLKKQDGKTSQIDINLPKDHTPIHITACPHQNDTLAYVSGNNLHVVNVQNMMSSNLTQIVNKHPDVPDVIAGEASFVIQEEFDRYQGFWWQPQQCDGKFRILYETVNQEAVSTIDIPNFKSKGTASEKFKYPRVGEVNAKSDLSIVEFEMDTSSSSIRTTSCILNTPLFRMFSEFDYLVRAGWLPNGKFIWFTLLTRDQKSMEVYVSPLSAFKPQESWELLQTTDTNWKPTCIICMNSPETWVPVLEMKFFAGDDPNSIRVIYLSEDDGFAHLYVQTIKFRNDDDGFHIVDKDKKKLTSGNWNVLEFWVDENRHLIFYSCFKIDPLKPQLFVTSYKFCGWHERISESDDFHYKVKAINAERGLVVLEYSNHSNFPGIDVYHVDFKLQSLEQPPIVLVSKKCSLMDPLEHVEVMTTKKRPFIRYIPPPETVVFTTQDGITLRGLVFTPYGLPASGKYPCIHYVYGGPGVQLIDGSYAYGSMLKYMKWCHFGYVVIVCDNRGSSNRGHSFAAQSKHRLGLVEMGDQVSFLKHVANTYNCIDMDRVGITGWSYGGFMTLMAMARYNHIYKMGIAGGSVTNWLLYDTGYTERYMGLLEEESNAYWQSNIDPYVNGFPNEANRLFLVHGGADENVHFYHVTELIQMLVKYGKPYTLLLYPQDRHRILSGSLHLEASMLFYFEQYLKK